MTDRGAYTHGTALVVREAGVLIRGASGAGKSRLALLLVAEAGRQRMFARLVGDDRVHMMASGGRLIARGHPQVVGTAERRGLGIIEVPYEAACVLRIIVDLVPDEPPRWPEDGQRRVAIDAVILPRIALRAGLTAVDAAELLERLAQTDH